MSKPFGSVSVDRGDLPSYIHDFSKARELVARGAIAQLIMPMLCETFLDHESMKRRLEAESHDAMFWRDKRMAENKSVRDEIDPLWYLIRKDPHSGSCEPVPKGIDNHVLLAMLRESVRIMYNQVGENLLTRLENLSTLIYTGIMKTIEVEYQTPGEGDESDSWFVFQAGLCLASFPTQEAADKYASSVRETLVKALDNQGIEGVRATMEGRAPRYVDKWTGDVPEEVEE